MTRGGAEEGIGPGWRGHWLRARAGARKSAVDYFRGHASDGLGLVALLLVVPALAYTTVCLPVWCPVSALVLPIIVVGLMLRPSSLLSLYVASAVALLAESVALGPYRQGTARVTAVTVLVVTAVALTSLAIAQF